MTGYQSKKAAAQDKLAQPAQEPVAWAVVGDGKFGKYELGQVFVDYEATHTYWENRGYELVPVYTTPPQRQPLTDEQISDTLPGYRLTDAVDVTRAIEVAHGIKENT